MISAVYVPMLCIALLHYVTGPLDIRTSALLPRFFPLESRSL
jgi:hypothetical protein